MTFQIIIKQRPNKFGRTRTEICKNIRNHCGGSGGMSDDHLDKCQWLEKKYNKAAFIPATLLDSDLSEHNE